jgi:hypothetical protein
MFINFSEPARISEWTLNEGPLPESRECRYT